MRSFLLLWRREVGSFFLSPIAYIMSFFFLVVMGVGFGFTVQHLTAGSMSYEVLQNIYASFFPWLSVLIAVPVLTMRSFAEERKFGTIETLMTAPVSDTAVVLSKYFGCLLFYVVMWIPTISYIFIINKFSTTKIALDPGALLGAYLGGLLIGGLFVAIGIFCSSFTSNQIVAAIMSFAVMMMLFMAGLVSHISNIEWVARLTGYFSSLAHMMDFSRGVVDSRPVVYYVTSTAAVLFATIRVVEARKWK